MAVFENCFGRGVAGRWPVRRCVFCRSEVTEPMSDGTAPSFSDRTKMQSRP